MQSLNMEKISFSKKEINGTLIVIAIILGVLILPVTFTNRAPLPAKADSAWITAANNLAIADSNGYNNASFYSTANNNKGSANWQNIPAGTLFKFDPNTLDGEGFKKLGLRDKTIQTLLNYRGKGGQFRKPEDLQKIYGLRPDEFARLQPYIAIENSHSNYYSKPYYNNNYDAHAAKAKQVIDINTADTIAFQSLYGIGSKLAYKIVMFREKLGGFYSIDQVGETYGVPPETFANIKSQLVLQTKNIKKLNLNNATYDELNAHPYISGKLAALIMKYRRSATFSDYSQLQELVAETNDVYEKVLPYVVF